MANKERVTKLFLDLLKINSPSKRERKVADFLKARLQSLGFDVCEDDAGEKIGGDAGNIIAFKKGTAPGAKSIFLGAHIDTIESTDKLNVVIEGDEVRSDGTTILGADDKAGIAAILEGIESVLDSGSSHGDIQVVFNVAEEIGLMGSRAMDISQINADFGYIFDTQKPAGGITVSAPSHANMFIDIKGRAAHAGMAPEHGISAILAASNAISKMKLGRIDFETTANIGVIEGGKARNIVPDHVEIKAEARSRDESKLLAQVEHMTAVFESEAEAIGANAVVRCDREYFSFKWTQDDEIVKLAVAACNKIGIEPTFMDGGGGSDANIFNAAGIACVVVGVGYDGAHSSSERISLNDLATAAAFVQAIIETAARAEE
ncbi:MAG: M20/M25/M40 family metallo-hydrolase [Armatimonadota bacterium]|nr:M20/M25/M40 family metallo-hydrolase [bacterium]